MRATVIVLATLLLSACSSQPSSAPKDGGLSPIDTGLSPDSADQKDGGLSPSDTGLSPDSADQKDEGLSPSDTGLSPDLTDWKDEGLSPDLVDESDGGLSPDLPPPAAPKSYSHGVCPQFTEGDNVIMSGGFSRGFRLLLPDAPGGAPVVFMFHGHFGTPEGMVNSFSGQFVADTLGAIVVAPGSCCFTNQACCDPLGNWNFPPMSDHDADLVFFDDLLSCTGQQFGADLSRVYAIGVSAGGLWGSYVIMHRSEYLAAASIFSGGTGFANIWSKPDYPLAVMLVWGGETDLFTNGPYALDFHDMMTSFSFKLQGEGHFVVECNHGQGHKVPPGSPQWAAQFLFPHVWGDWSSPYETGLPPIFPDYCDMP